MIFCGNDGAVHTGSRHSRNKRPGCFLDAVPRYLLPLQKERHISNQQLSEASLVRIKTIQRIRNDEDYQPTVQTVLGLCVGLKLPPPDAKMFFEKSDCKLNAMKYDGYVYECILASCSENSIFEINEMLEKSGIKPLGSDPELSYSNYQRKTKSG